jgi:uncharacterized protein
MSTACSEIGNWRVFARRSSCCAPTATWPQRGRNMRSIILRSDDRRSPHLSRITYCALTKLDYNKEMRPADIFDRDEEWALLESHLQDGRARLGIVTGRRRVGKTFLLRRLVERHGGLFLACLEEDREPALRRFADALGAHHGVTLGTPPDWSAAMGLATQGPLAVPLLVIDEFPYLQAHSPELESVIQHVIDQSRDRDGTRVVLSGSSLAVMGGLLGGGRPLRGRADLQLTLAPFDYRVSADYWGITDPSVALRVDAALGGSPGYRTLAPPPPVTLDGFEEWVVESLMNPASALYREDSYLLGEDRRFGDRAIYMSVLRAIAGGDHRPSRIAGRVGRAQTSLSHVFRVLTEAGFLRNEEGVLSGRDPLYQVVDPVLTFLHSCVEPWRGLIDEGRRSQAWGIATTAWHAQVLGPHLEKVARVWAARFADPEILGGPAGIVGRAEVPDAIGRVSREIDVAVLAPGEQAGKGARVQAIGESKLTADIDALRHLDRCADLLEARGHGHPDHFLIVCETSSSALDAMVDARSDVELVHLDRLYGVADLTNVSRSRP